MVAPVVGREEEQSAISAVANAALRDRQAAAVLVVGEPGQGKTRLLAEAGRPAGFDHDLPVLGYEPERNVPRGVTREMLRSLTDAVDLKGHPIAVLAGDRPAALEPLRLVEAGHGALRKLGPVVRT